MYVFLQSRFCSGLLCYAICLALTRHESDTRDASLIVLWHNGVNFCTLPDLMQSHCCTSS
jgi:hypothetical protein